MARDATNRKPDMVLKAYNQQTDKSSIVGAGWRNSNGSVSIKLNDFVVLQQTPVYIFTLFPKDDGPK